MSVEQNKRVATKYHRLRPDEMDEILTPDFKGEHAGSSFSWNLSQHKENWSKLSGTDTIHEQFGEGDLVCTRFTRKTTYQGKDVVVDMMHIKQFRGGKIAHIWEYMDAKQVEKQL